MSDYGDVLFVDDNKADLQLALHVLTQYGNTHPVHTVRDGEEALNFIFGKGPYAGRTRSVLALVLLDLKLPKVSGMEILRAIKNSSETKALPVVVFSSSRQISDVDTCYRLGANGYVQKPVAFEEFENAVRKIADYWLRLNLPASGDGSLAYHCELLSGNVNTSLNQFPERRG